jgi:hypothetical protein
MRNDSTLVTVILNDVFEIDEGRLPDGGIMFNVITDNEEFNYKSVDSPHPLELERRGLDGT